MTQRIKGFKFFNCVSMLGVYMHMCTGALSLKGVQSSEAVVTGELVHFPLHLRGFLGCEFYSSCLWGLGFYHHLPSAVEII